VTAALAAAAVLSGSWTGTYSLPAASDPVDISVQLHGKSALVALGRGHASLTSVPVAVRGAHVRFVFPGGVAFDGMLKGNAVSGTVWQAKVRGSFALRRGASRVLSLFGLYRSAEGKVVTVNQATGFSPWLVELPTGEVHGIGPPLTVGDRLGDTVGNGSVAVDPGGLTWKGTRYARVALRQREVRVGVTAATLTLPPGPGPFPAVAMVHGSGPQTREEFQSFAAYVTSLGVAVLAGDKRGIGQSLGRYPGERASESTIDILARDAQAEARYLAALPEIDPTRVGLLGDSQAGWIIALAASREPAVRFAVPIVGPSVTVGESDLWGSLAGKGQSQPSGSPPSLLQQVRQAGPSGFDPVPYLRTLSIPAFWVFGADDRNVPTELCVERLTALRAGHDFSWAVLPMTHTPLVLPTGLLSSLPESPGFAPAFFPAIGDWLRSRSIVR
jgi:dienelactone hydrolase